MDDKKELIISVNLLGKEIDELSYEKSGDSLKIYLKPKYGKLSPSDVSCETPAGPETNTGFLKLVGRILARTQKISSRDFWWSFIPESDFTDTKTSPKDIVSALEKIKANFEIPALAVFWAETNSPTVIKGSVMTDDENLLRGLAQKISGEVHKNRFSFTLGVKKPEEAIKSFFNLL